MSVSNTACLCVCECPVCCVYVCVSMYVGGCVYTNQVDQHLGRHASTANANFGEKWGRGVGDLGVRVRVAGGGIFRLALLVSIYFVVDNDWILDGIAQPTAADLSLSAFSAWPQADVIFLFFCFSPC
jgi:hypothetical protein